MAAYLPCSCGHRLPANATTLAPGARCPACGRDLGDRSLIVEPEPVSALHPVAATSEPQRGFGFRAVEVASIPGSREAPPASTRPIEWRDPVPDDGIPYAMAPLDPDIQRNPNEIDRLREARRHMREARLGGPQLWNSWERERGGLDCLAYPVRAWGIISVLSFFLMVGHVTITFIVEVSAISESSVGYVLAAPIVFAFAMLVGIWLRVTLLSGEAGECDLSLLNRFDVPAFFMTLASGLLAFLAGPILAFVMAGWFWVTAGKLTFADRTILIVLGWLAYSWWIAGGLAAHDEERILSVHPNAIARLLHRRGGFLAGACVACGLVLALTSWWIGECHFLRERNAALAFFLALAFWWNALFWLTFLARWLGIRHFWRSPQGRAAAGK